MDSPHPEDHYSNDDEYNQWHIEMTMGIDEVNLCMEYLIMLMKLGLVLLKDP